MLSIETILASHRMTGGGTVNVTTGTNRPTTGMREGLIFFNEDTGEFFIYLNKGWKPLSGGVGITPSHAKITLTNDTDTVNIPFLDYIPIADLLFITLNTTSLQEDDHFTIDTTQKKVKKKGGGTWKNGDVLRFTRLAATPSNNASLNVSLGIATYEDHVTIAAGTQMVEFDIPYFKVTTDILKVYQRNMPLFKDVNYTLNEDGKSITLLYETSESEEFHFEVLKKVRTYANDETLIEEVDRRLTEQLAQTTMLVANPNEMMPTEYFTKDLNLNGDILWFGRYGISFDDTTDSFNILYDDEKTFENDPYLQKNNPSMLGDLRVNNLHTIKNDLSKDRLNFHATGLQKDSGVLTSPILVMGDKCGDISLSTKATIKQNSLNELTIEVIV